MGTIDAHEPPRRGAQVQRVMTGLLDRIDRGLIAMGGRLPSIREAARSFGVSKNTAITAYERLVASGRVEARPGSGFYVSGRRPLPPAPKAPEAVDAVDSVWLLREQLERQYEVRVGEGRPPPSWMEGSEVGRHLSAGTRSLGRSVPESYGSPYGHRPLRERLALMLAERSIHCGPDGILMTAGANHALDLIVRHLVQPDEPVLVDAPGYYVLFGKLRLARARMIGVRRTPDGPDLDDLARKAAASGARLFFTQSLAQNPTGCSITLPIAHRLLRIAADADLRIVENDAFGDVLPPGSPRLAALDQLDRVIYVGTFAKTLSANLRSGYIAAEPRLVAELRDLKMLTSVNSSGFVERALHALIDSGQYRRHLRRLAGRIEAAARDGREVLDRLRLPVFGEPSGGFYVWCGLPGITDMDAFSRRAAANSILIAPGGLFHPDGVSEAPMMRVNVAHLADPRFERFIRDELLDAAKTAPC